MNRARIDSMGTKISEVSHIALFPNREGSDYTYLALCITDSKHHILIWSPHVTDVSCNIQMEINSLYSDSLFNISTSRYISFGGKGYASSELEEGIFFKMFDLDYPYNRKISKKELEQFLECEVID